MARVCFLGIGNMGLGMASKLIEADHNVQIYNRTQSKALSLVEKGAALFDTPRQAASGADVVISMVGDDSASRSMWLGNDGALTSGLASAAIIIECSTISHDWVMELSAIVHNMDFIYLDSPVTGSPADAAAGELTLFLGGDAETIARAQPYLEPLSNSQIHFGAIGSGTAYKLIVNLMGSIQIAATAEGLLVAEKAGLDLKLVAKALADGAAGSSNVVRNSAQMANSTHEEDVLFNARWRLKDTKYGVKFADKLGQEILLGKTAENLFQKLVDAGYARSAESKIIDVLRG